jgi:hypothetical protein
MSQYRFSALGSLGSWVGLDGEFKISSAIIKRVRALPVAALKTVADAIERAARANLQRVTKQRSGRLLKGLKARAAKSKGEIAYYRVGTKTRHLYKNYTRKSRGLAKAAGRQRGYGVHIEFGHNIVEYKRKWKGLVQTRKVVGKVPARPFLRPARVRVSQNLDAVLAGTWEKMQ